VIKIYLFVMKNLYSIIITLSKNKIILLTIFSVLSIRVMNMSSNVRSHRKNVASVDVAGGFESINLIDNDPNDLFESNDA
jgi:hypothetical protein